MSKKIIYRICIALITVSAVIVFVELSKKNENTTKVEDTVTIHQSRAIWVSKAKTVSELMLESDIVVKVRVIEAPVTRVVSIEAPTLDEKGNIIASTVLKVLFSDTVFEVLKTYSGKSSSTITIMQTGGFDQSVSNSIEETIDDGLYKVGEEYILFLVDISGDRVHAPNRELYRIVNPFGRYRIDGETVFSYGENFGQDIFTIPSSLNELELQIAEAIKLLPAPTEFLETLTPLVSEDIEETITIEPTGTNIPEEKIETSTPTPTETITPTP